MKNRIVCYANHGCSNGPLGGGQAGGYDPILYGPGNGCPLCHHNPCSCNHKGYLPIQPNMNLLPSTTGQLCPECQMYIASQQELHWHLRNHILLKKLQPRNSKPWPIVPEKDYKHLCDSK